LLGVRAVAVRRDLRAGEPVLDETWWRWRRDRPPARGRQRGTAVLVTTEEQPLRVSVLFAQLDPVFSIGA
jgi:hypothetical protein